MRSATKAIRQKKAAQVEASREIIRTGSTAAQMNVGRMASERRWRKNMRLQRASVRTCTCWLCLLQKMVQQKHFERITAAFGTCSWKGVVYGASCAMVGTSCAVVGTSCAVVVVSCAGLVSCAVVGTSCAVVVVSCAGLVDSSD